MMVVMCCNIWGDLDTEPSVSIWAASEMVEMGVLNSWVMLLMKSFLISATFFCLTKRKTITIKVMQSTMVKARAGIMKRTELNM